MNTVGIDVSSKTLDVAIRIKNKIVLEKKFENTPDGHQTIINLCLKRKAFRVCLEATGIYHLDLAIALFNAQNIDVMIVNPSASKSFGDAMMSRNKTDRSDATMLAEFAERMEFISWVAPSDEILLVRACSRRLSMLTQQKASAKNQLHAFQATQATPSFIIEDASLTISQIENQIKLLKEKTLTIIDQHEELKMVIELLISVKGIAETSAIQLIGELLVLPQDMKAKQWVAFAGLDIKQHQSGTSINKKSRISKKGNRYLRGALYMPAMSATQHDPNIKAYYVHLQDDNGLTKRQALCAVMRKLLHAIHGMLKTKMPFDSSRFYQHSVAK